MEKRSRLVNKRIELSGIFEPLNQAAKRRWGRLFSSDWETITNRFAELADEWNYSFESSSDTFLWIDEKNSSTECMFCFIRDITNLESVSAIFEKIKEHQPFFTYAIVHQKKDGNEVYDIFRFSPFSYLEHCNRVRDK